jgi:hypothetical protein
LENDGASSCTGAIIGGSVAGAIAVLAAVFAFVYYRRWSVSARRRRALDLAAEECSPKAIEPFSPLSPEVHVFDPYSAFAGNNNQFSSTSPAAGLVVKEGWRSPSSVLNPPFPSASSSRPRRTSQESTTLQEMNDLREEVARLRMVERTRMGSATASIHEEFLPPPDYDQPSHSRFREDMGGGRSENGGTM